MTRLGHVLVALLALVGTAAAPSASAQGVIRAVLSNATPTASICVRDLRSVQCGRYQDRILHAEVQRLNRATNAAAVREVGRRQLDALIASVD